MRRVFSFRSLLLLFVLYISLPSHASAPRWQHFYKTVTLGDSFTVDPWNDIRRAGYMAYKTSVQTNSDVSAINITEVSKTKIQNVYGYTGGVICTYRIDTHKTGEFKIAFKVISYYKQFTSIDQDECYATYHITVSPKPVPVESISFDVNNVELNVGDKRVISATVSPSNAADKSLTWNTDNKTVATVDASGVVEAKAPGQAVITAKANDGSGKTAKCVVTVKAATVSVTSVTLNKTTAELEVGKTLTLTATVAPSNATDKSLTWSSSNTSVATVNNGTVTAVKEGTAKITCKASNGVSASCQVTVKAKSSGVLVTSITLAQGIELIEGQKVYVNTLSPKILPENATNKNVSWTSSNTKIISIGTELISLTDVRRTLNAKSAGECTITATAIDGSNVSGKATVKVKPRYSITLDKSAIQLSKGESLTLKAEEYDNLMKENTHASAESLTWTSSNTNVAIVDKTGKVTAVNEGKATITCNDTFDDFYYYIGTVIPASCEVTVLSNTILVEKVTLNNSSIEIGIGETKTLVATISPSNATNKALEWSSSNKSIATVDGNGKVTAVSAGKATITAKAKDGSNKSATCAVTVKAATVSVTSVTLNKTTAELEVGKTLTLTATVAPSNATNKTLEWSSSNKSIASVDGNGKVTAVSAGKATITARAKDGSNKSATCAITVKAATVSVTSVTLNKTTAELEVGKTLTLTATVAPSNATNKTLEWSSSNKSIASVDGNGKVTAVSAGKATITARAKDGSNKSATCAITVKAATVSVTSVTLNKTTAELEVGKTLTLTATVAPSNATNKALTWSSSNTSVATVDGNGKVTAVSAGNATITAKAKDGSNKSATCAVTVKAAAVSVTSVTLNKTTAELEVGKTLTLTATVAPSNATNKTLEWSSSNKSIASVDGNGKVTAVSAGKATITAKAKDGSNKSATCAVTVKAATVSVTSVTLNKTTAELEVGKTLTLTATVAPSNATNKTLEWSSSNKSIASVDGNGKVTAVSAGNVTITAKAKDGSNKSATCAVTVKAAAVSVTSVTLNKTTAELEVGKTLTLTATVAPSNATNKALTWSSSKTSVATVDGNGKVTAVSAGNATITAKAKDGSNKSATCAVTVKAATVSVTSVTLNKTTAELEVGKTLTLTATVAPSNATNKTLDWSSSNTSIVTVDANGKVTAVAAGKATITAKAKDGSNKSATCAITVKAATVSVTSVTLNKTTAELEVGKTLTLTATVAPSNATNKALTWSSSNTSVATVDGNGKVTAVAAGKATITAKAKDGSNKSATCTVTVKAATVSVTSVTLNKTTAELEVGGTLTLTATVGPSNATNKALTWSSSNTSIAKVDANGKVTAVAAGKATITVKATDGSNKSATCVITVKDSSTPTDISKYSNIIYPEAITVSPESEADLTVKMKNATDNSIMGFQFDLALPTGVNVAKDEDGFYQIELSGDRTTSRKHTVATSLQSNGAIRVVCYSNNNNTFSGKDGAVLNVKLKVDKSIAIGEYPIYLRDVVMTTPTMNNYTISAVVSKLTVEEYKKGDVNGDKTVNVVDVAGVVNLILGNNITGLNKKAADINGDNIVNVVDVAGVVNIILGQSANSRAILLAPSANKTSLYIDDIDLVPGETKEVKVNLNNPDDVFTGCQFDLYLPKGISIVEEDGYALVDIGSRSNSRKHTVSTSLQPDGATRVVCYSNNNNTFSGEQGDILTVTLHVANNAAAGNYNLRIGNITLSRSDVTGLTLDDYSARVSIIPTGINNAWAESISNSPVYTVSGQRLKKPRKGINIIDGRKVIVK